MGIEACLRGVQQQSLDWMVEHFPGVGLDRRAESFVSIFKEYIPPSARVLDIGGGWGFYVAPLERGRDCQVTVLDVREPRFRKAPVVVYDGEKFPFPDRSFDVSLLITVLHHVVSPERLLAEARRVTRRWVIVVEDLYQSTVGRIWTILRDSFYNLEIIGHPRQFRTKEEWFDCFKKLGFRVGGEKEITTSLLGIPILNGCFFLDCS